MSDDDEEERLVWAASRVTSIDAATGEFEVLVHEFDGMDPDDPEYDEAYTDGPYVAAQEETYVDGYAGRWRRAPRVSEGWSKWEGNGRAAWPQISDLGKYYLDGGRNPSGGEIWGQGFQSHGCRIWGSTRPSLRSDI